MKIVNVKLGQRSYDILIGAQILGSTGAHFREHGVGNRVFIVANISVYELYGKALVDQLKAEGFDVVHLLIPDGERYKTIQTVENIHTYLIAQRADRKSTLVALGGGVTGDVVGFVAATFLRGVPYVQIPTTLLSQVDSSVGGKTGVNHRLGKNLIGAFYQPNLVCIDTQSLFTLPEREFQSGLYEVLKYGLIYDSDFFDLFAQKLDVIKKRDSGVLETLISRCCEIKAEVTSIDEKEENLRRILNFGHTLGHALEVATAYDRYTHGEAVAYGMLTAVRLSFAEGDLDKESLGRIERVILDVGPLPPASDVPVSSLLDSIKHDKKRLDDKTFFVLLKEIGQTAIQSGLSESLLSEVWDEVVAVASSQSK